MTQIFIFSTLFYACLINIIYSFDFHLSSEKGACVSSLKLCNNGAKCTKMGKYEFCKCLPGTFGDDCGIVPDCIDEVIKCNETSHSECGYNIRLEEAECICNNSDLAYDVNIGACRLTCSSGSECVNGASCIMYGHYNFCRCVEGTLGDRCEIVAECYRRFLKCSEESGAICGYNIKLKRAECLCEDGRQYDEITKRCRETCNETNQCTNGGICSTTGNYNFCRCVTGTNGDMCEIVTACFEKTLTCQNGAICDFNEIEKRPECLCQNGLKYDSLLETCRETCSETKPCTNGGICSFTGHYNFCRCITGTYGDTCKIVKACFEKTLTCNNQSGVVCGFNVIEKRPECLCENGLKYDSYQDTCREECVSQLDCQNGAFCNTTDSYNFCECLPGTYGHHCENVTDCDSNYLTCNGASGAKCGYNPRLEVAECLCEDNLKYDTYSETCRKTCDPILNPCINGASCKNVFGYDFCFCHLGTYGNLCEYIADCVNNTIECNVTSGSKCGFNVNTGNAECLCEDKTLVYDRKSEMCLSYISSTDVRVSTTQFTSTFIPTIVSTDVPGTRLLLSTTTVSNVNKCNGSSDVCPIVSTECVPIGNDFYCKCKTGFRLRTGAIRENNKKSCIRRRCDCGVNSYKCQWNSQGRKICSCFLGYSQIGGVCTACNCGIKSMACEFDAKGRKLCACEKGYLQRNGTCSEMCGNDKECQNKGKCEYENNGFFCKCKAPFKGDKCEMNEECEQLSYTCHTVGAVCQYIESLRKGFCVCPPNQTFNDKTNICEENYESRSFLFIILCITSGFLLVSTVILVIVFKKFKSKRSKEWTGQK